MVSFVDEVCGVKLTSAVPANLRPGVLVAGGVTGDGEVAGRPRSTIGAGIADVGHGRGPGGERPGERVRQKVRRSGSPPRAWS